MVARKFLVGFSMAVFVVASGGCTKKEPVAKKEMTKAERDSAIAESKLPGAGVVKKAIEVSDSAETRANRPIPEPR